MWLLHEFLRTAVVFFFPNAAAGQMAEVGFFSLTIGLATDTYICHLESG